MSRWTVGSPIVTDLPGVLGPYLVAAWRIDTLRLPRAAGRAMYYYLTEQNARLAVDQCSFHGLEYVKSAQSPLQPPPEASGKNWFIAAVDSVPPFGVAWGRAILS